MSVLNLTAQFIFSNNNTHRCQPSWPTESGLQSGHKPAENINNILQDTMQKNIHLIHMQTDNNPQAQNTRESL